MAARQNPVALGGRPPVEPGDTTLEDGRNSAFDSLSIFEDTQEDALIELSSVDSNEWVAPRRTLQHFPEDSTGPRVQRYQQGYSLLDVDDIVMVPPNSHDSREATTSNGAPMQRSTSPLLSLFTETSELEGYGDAGSSNLGPSTYPEPEERCYCGSLPASDMRCYFCYPCGHVFCDRCWGRSPPHVRKRVQGGIPHEKTDPRLAKIIEQTLEVELDEKQQSWMHLKDENSSWFGTMRDDDDDMVFHDHGRFADLMAEMSARKRQVRYPGLVSFVGQTGAGKSTVVKLLIELQSISHPETRVPVVGSATNQELPTSGDVHLYSDPVSWATETPILYADCEGLDGGEREPLGVKIRKVGRRIANHAVPDHFEIKARHNTTTRDLLWATTEKTKSREYIVRNLYPRLLYTFSDTIVFVTKNPRVVENVVDQLIDWATAALEKSSNQPVLPHAIIVLNAAENSTDPRLWDIDESTDHLMESMNEAIMRNHNLRARVRFWVPRQRRITSMRELLLSYYSDIRVVRVPERGRPKLINQQIERLYEEVEIACRKSREAKHKLRMLLNSDELQPYLQYAFDHFSRDLEMPFDFVQASFANSPIPSDFGGNILKLAINILDVWSDCLDGPAIFRELSYIIASATMLDSARRKTLGPAESVFREYLDHFDDALDDFCDRHWPCEYVSAQGRCVNVRSGHQAKGHQLRSGRVIAIADYESSFSADGFRTTFRSMIFANLDALLRKLGDATFNAANRELEEAAAIHRDLVLMQFFHHLGGPSKFISHTVCYTCLVEPPEHLLPCGHVLCTPCIKAFGVNRVKNVYEMVACPMHRDRTEGQFPEFWPISIKPHGAGTRILSLDGGGVRGIVELTILQQIEKALGQGLYIQDFFDLIVGTSTGGIIALGLGAHGLSVQDSIYNFRRLCKKAFTRRKGAGIPVLERIITASNHSKFETKPLEDALRSIYGDTKLFGGSRGNMEEPLCLRRLTKVAVTTTTTAASVVVLANYNRHGSTENQSYRFYRSEKPESEMKVWESARATSAAPRIFKPFFHNASGQEYQDGAIYHNNPIDVAYREQKLIWPDMADSHPDIVLSIGTGYNPNSQTRDTHLSRPGSRGMISYVMGLAKIAMDHIHSSLDSERTWRVFLERTHPPSRFLDRYVRANLALDNDPPSLDNVEMIDTLSEMTRSRFTKDISFIQFISDRLVASSFYFEQSSSAMGAENGDGTFTINGHILSRFPPGSSQIHSLGEAFHRRSRNIFNRGSGGHQPYFVVRERRREREGKLLVISEDVIQSMIAHGKFSMRKIQLRVAERMAETEICLCLDGDRAQPTLYPISGFPKCMLEADMTSPSIKAKFSQRLSRSRSSQSRTREQWHGLLSRGQTHPLNPIDHYTDPSYQYPGDETYHGLQSLSERFSTARTDFDPFEEVLPELPDNPVLPPAELPA